MKSVSNSQLHLQIGQEVIYLVMTGAVMGCVILAAYLVQFLSDETKYKSELNELRIALRQTQDELDKVRKPASKTKKPVKTPRDKPPIVLLREADGFNFAPGSAEISTDFASRIQSEILPKIKEIARTYKARVVEVVGHTDGVPVGPNLRVRANLDNSIAPYIHSHTAIAPVPFDNIGLGMARAVTVARALSSAGLSLKMEILPMSAGSLISLDDRLNPSGLKDDDRTRRRIEIRIRRRNAHVAQ